MKRELSLPTIILGIVITVLLLVFYGYRLLGKKPGQMERPPMSPAEMQQKGLQQLRKEGVRPDLSGGPELGKGPSPTGKGGFVAPGGNP